MWGWSIANRCSVEINKPQIRRFSQRKSVEICESVAKIKARRKVIRSSEQLRSMDGKGNKFGKLHVHTYICVVKLEQAIQSTKFKDEVHKAILNTLYTAWWLKTVMSKELKEFGLTHEQYNVLRILKGKYPEQNSLSRAVISKQREEEHLLHEFGATKRGDYRSVGQIIT